MAGPEVIGEDVRQAETLLYDLAVMLRQVPLREHTRELHLRALQLKRDVGQWVVHPPARSVRQAAIEQLMELHGQAVAWLRRASHQADGTT